MFLVPRLSAAFLLRFTLGRGGFGMGMHAAGRQRGVLGRLSPAFQLLDACLQFGNLRQQQANDGLGLRRLAGDDFFRDRRACPLLSPSSRLCVQINLSTNLLQGVNDYGWGCLPPGPGTLRQPTPKRVPLSKAVSSQNLPELKARRKPTRHPTRILTAETSCTGVQGIVRSLMVRRSPVKHRLFPQIADDIMQQRGTFKELFSAEHGT